MKTQKLHATNIWSITKQLWAGKSILRALMNEQCRTVEINGSIVDLGSGKTTPNYYSFFKHTDLIDITLTDGFYSNKNVFKIDLEKPFKFSKKFNTVVCCNVLEHLYDPIPLIQSAYDALHKDGTFIGFVPFFIRVHPDPNDYHRYTGDYISSMLKQNKFSDINVTVIGVGPFVAAFSQIIDFIWRPFRPFIALPAIGIDVIINRHSDYHKNAYPLGYFFIAKKK
jgi:SAM-dependent methyltransferase